MIEPDQRAFQPLATQGQPSAWPMKRRVLGVGVSVTDYETCQRLVMEAAKCRESRVVTHLAVHGIASARLNRAFARTISRFDIVAPDGQPVRFALDWFHRTDLPDRCYGPELMLRLCRAAAAQGVSVYLYGSTPEVIERLGRELPERAPGLRIAGAESPPFRALTEAEDEAVTRRINDSGAGLVFVGLGLPRQDYFAAAHQGRIQAVQLCVGAAFDFLAGTKPSAPVWMQKRGLEWLFRLRCEPRRLWRRYLLTNALFCLLFAANLWRGRRRVQ